MNNKIIIEEFTFGNFRSFKDMQSLNMTAAKLKSRNPSLDTDNVYDGDGKGKVLKSKIIYGANASGKSNVIKALKCFIDIITKCLQDKNVLTIVVPFFFSTDTEDKPSFFQLIFRSGGVQYRYGFEADNKKIHTEWLYLVPESREVPIFTREDLNIDIQNQARFAKGAEIASLKNKLFNESTLFLSVADSFGDALAQKVIGLISSIAILDEPTSLDLFEKNISTRLKNEEDKKLIVNLLKMADVGINNLDLLPFPTKEGEDKDLIVSTHSVYDADNKVVSESRSIFAWDESEGTQSLLKLSPQLIDTIREGKPIFIDEFGSKLHPLLIRKILNLFHSSNTCSQLIAATHNTDLFNVDLLRRDQIDLVEKNKYGASELYTLLELKGIRKNAVVDKEYLKGKYGAIPVLGNWENCINLFEDGEENQYN